MKIRRLLALPLLLAPALMAPTCKDNEQDAGTGADTSQKLSVLRCSDTGQFLGGGYAFAGDSIWLCTAKVYDATCECPEVLEQYQTLLDVPYTAPSPDAAALVCWGEITVNPYPEQQLVERYCEPLGVYQPGPAGPQSVAPDRSNEG